VFCREHGRQLSDLAKSTGDKDNAELMKGFQLFGVVKEIGVDDKGLSEFYNDHYTYPLYKDDALTFYNDFFNKRKLGFTTYNPLKLYSGFKTMTKRVKKKGLKGNMVGEGFVKGGVVIFDKGGKAVYAYEEETFTELVVDDIVAALKALQGEK